MMDHGFSEKVLCVDDEVNVLNVFKRTLGRHFDLIVADSGEKALGLLSEHPDVAVILSDYAMPGINGVEFLKQARLIAPDAIQLLLTGNIELDVAVNAINETDIFRYLPKPCPAEVLKKVIGDALAQYRLIKEKQRLTAELHETNRRLAERNETLARQKYILQYELEMAKEVYSKTLAFDKGRKDGIDYVNCPQQVVGGDFLLVRSNTSKQQLYAIMGDMTGHGLQSALAVLLIDEIFGAQVPNAPSVEELASCLNDKLQRKLPTGLFCAALIVKVDARDETLDLWVGGMPDVYLLDSHGRITRSINSDNLPLGIALGVSSSKSSFRCSLGEAESLFACSDGVTEQQGPEQTMFGMDRLTEALQSVPDSTRVDWVLERLNRFRGGMTQDDDLSLIEINFSRIRKFLMESA